MEVVTLQDIPTTSGTEVEARPSLRLSHRALVPPAPPKSLSPPQPPVPKKVVAAIPPKPPVNVAPPEPPVPVDKKASELIAPPDHAENVHLAQLLKRISTDGAEAPIPPKIDEPKKTQAVKEVVARKSSDTPEKSGKVKSWRFEIHRDSEGRMKEITATPKY